MIFCGIVFFHIYPSWYFVFCELPIPVVSYLLIILESYRLLVLQTFLLLHLLLVLLLVIQLCICYTMWNCPQLLNITFCFPLFPPFINALCFIRKFLLTYTQDHCFFPWLCPVYWWAYQVHASFMLQCFWFLAFTFKYFLEFFLSLLKSTCFRMLSTFSFRALNIFFYFLF